VSGPFAPSAHVYDLVYQHLDHPRSARVVESLIRERNPAADSVLDMSCGTGKHLAEWRGSFAEVEGADVDEAMVAVARARVGADISVHVADFTQFDLGRTYDAVTCLFSSIGYAHTPERLDAAIASMARHLAPGGVLVVEPWLLPEMIRPPFVRVHTAQDGEMVVARTNTHHYDEERGLSDMEFAYLVTTPDGTECFTEHHVMGASPPTRYVAPAQHAGLEAEFLGDAPTQIGRGLLVGVADG